MHPTTPRTTLLHHLLLFSITVLSLLHQTAAILERGVAYVDNYDPDSMESHEWHKRMNGVGVTEVRAEKIAAPRDRKRDGNRDFEWSVAPSGNADSTNEHDWAKRGNIIGSVAPDDDESVQDDTPDDGNGDVIWTKGKRMEWANAAGQGGYVADSREAQEGSEWGKRGESGTCAACVKRGTKWDGASTEDGPKRYYEGKAPPADDNDSHEWGKRGEIDWTAPPADDNDSNEWGKRADNAREDSYNNGVCASCLIKRIAKAIWPPALGKPENIGPGLTKMKPRDAEPGEINGGKRAPIDPSKNQPCVYAPGADGPTDNVPGGCRLDSRAGPGKRGDYTDDHHQTHASDSYGWLKKRSAKANTALSGPFQARFETSPFQKSQPFIPPIGKNLAVNKRGVIEEWMHPHAMEKRQRVCRDPGYALCPGTSGCCQSSDLCCPTAVCKTNPTEVCCPGYTCPQGYQCDRLCGGCVLSGGGCCPNGRLTCGPGQGCCPDGCFPSDSTCCRATGGACPAGQQCCGDGCAPAENVCCGSGGSCGKGNICVIWQGRQTCCTDLRCTAWISDGVSVPLVATATVEAPTEAPSPPPTTAPPAPPQETEVEVVYSTYYYTITWWYYFYYYTYYAVLDVSTVTSSATTIYTTVTITDTASEAASSKFEATSSSIVGEFTTPAEATTALATPTLPAETADDAPTEAATPTPTPPSETSEETTAEETTPSDTAETAMTETPPSETPVPLPTEVTTSSRPSRSTAPPLVSTGGSAGMVEVNRLLGWGMGGVAVVAGVGMVWL